MFGLNFSKTVLSGVDRYSTPKELISELLHKLITSKGEGWAHFYDHSAKRGVFPRRWFRMEFVEVALDEERLLLNICPAPKEFGNTLKCEGILIPENWIVQKKCPHLTIPTADVDTVIGFVDQIFLKFLKAAPNYQIAGYLENI